MSEIVFERVREVIVKVLKVESHLVTWNVNFRGPELNADSLDLVLLVMAFANEFRVEIQDEEIRKVKTVGDLVCYLSSASSLS